MKISVVIGTYHGEEYIAEQLLSLFHQTLPPDEILIGDDSLNTKTIDENNIVVLLNINTLIYRFLKK